VSEVTSRKLMMMRYKYNW